MIHHRKRILSLLLVMVLCMTLLPVAARAYISYPLSQTAYVYIGQPCDETVALAFASEPYVPVQLISTGDTLPPGLSVEQIDSDMIGLRGTPAAGTVGSIYYVYLKQVGGADDGETGTLTVEVLKGFPTIVQPDINWHLGDGNFKLAPYSTNRFGTRLTGIDLPTYTFSGGDPNIATVDSAGNVTVIGWGSIQVTVSSTESANYRTANKTFTLTVGNFAIPQTGDSNHLASWTAALIISAAGLGLLLMQGKGKGRRKAR